METTMSIRRTHLAGAFALILAGGPAAAQMTPRQIYQKDGPAVVLLMCTGKDGVGELGTGSLVDGNGHVLTNAHVVIKASTGEPYDSIHVYLKPAKLTGDAKQDLTHPMNGKVIKFDRALDLAVVELDEKPERSAVMPIGDSTGVQAGDPVVAIGHPEQGGLWTLTTGVVGTVIADLGGVKGKNVFQSDASINRGNSGGPLIDQSGSLIGVNSSMSRKAADGLAITGESFSLQANVVKDWLGDSVAFSAAPAKAPEIASAEPAPKAAAPAAAAPEAAPEAAPAETPKPAPPRKPKAPKAQIVTPKHPYVIDTLMKDMADMEDMEKDMHGEFQKLNARPH